MKILRIELKNGTERCLGDEIELDRVLYMLKNIESVSGKYICTYQSDYLTAAESVHMCDVVAVTKAEGKPC